MDTDSVEATSSDSAAAPPFGKLATQLRVERITELLNGLVQSFLSDKELAGRLQQLQAEVGRLRSEVGRLPGAELSQWAQAQRVESVKAQLCLKQTLIARYKQSGVELLRKPLSLAMPLPQPQSAAPATTSSSTPLAQAHLVSFNHSTHPAASTIT